MQNTTDEDGGFKLPSKTLKVLGQGLEKARADHQVIGMRENLSDVSQPLVEKWEKI